MGRIVVGVDGSEHSVRALRWALAEAKARNATVEALITWSYPVIASDGFSGGAVVAMDVAALERSAGQALEGAIEEAEPDATARQAIARRVVEGNPGHALVEASRGADLLVVGSRGHGGFTGLLLGSVSNQCVHHAHCPVTVIRPEAS